MPPSDDDIFKRMFANFVRKRQGGAPPASSQHHQRQTNDHRPPDALRKLATDFNGRNFAQPAPPMPDILTHQHSSHAATLHRQPSRHADARPSMIPTSILNNGRISSLSPDVEPDIRTPSPPPPRKSFSKPTGKLPRASKGSKGSKGSDKGVSASTEDAPPRKRTRTHPHPALHRSQSAHAGSLHSSRSKNDKQRNNSRFNLPPATTPPVLDHEAAGPSNAQQPSAGNPTSSNSNKSATKSFPCDQCNAVFAQKGQLSRHTRRVHEKLRPHACEYCGRLFGARSDRTRHVMVSLLFFFPPIFVLIRQPVF